MPRKTLKGAPTVISPQAPVAVACVQLVATALAAKAFSTVLDTSNKTVGQAEGAGFMVVFLFIIFFPLAVAALVSGLVYFTRQRNAPLMEKIIVLLGLITAAPYVLVPVALVVWFQIITLLR